MLFMRYICFLFILSSQGFSSSPREDDRPFLPSILAPLPEGSFSSSPGGGDRSPVKGTCHSFAGFSLPKIGEAYTPQEGEHLGGDTPESWERRHTTSALTAQKRLEILRSRKASVQTTFSKSTLLQGRARQLTRLRLPVIHKGEESLPVKKRPFSPRQNTECVNLFEPFYVKNGSFVQETSKFTLLQGRARQLTRLRLPVIHKGEESLPVKKRPLFSRYKVGDINLFESFSVRRSEGYRRRRPSAF